ncbi:MAG: hypothetical protein QOG98_1659 [Pseudonocardiales bacterium]|jgi:hypothetical protein|nr:hypothetical protein [Pseudonocardiales bacterium]
MPAIRHDEAMPGDDALTEAIDELYSADPDDFVKRRGALASQARQDGDPKAATAITALRRPTKAAWLINRLVRADPDVASGLAELAKKLRDAQRTLDGAKLRELTQQRRKLIDRAIRQAFNLSGQAESAAALRQEVASTLEAALADPDVADQLATGTLVRSAEWSGFGDSTPTLSAVPPLRAAEPKSSGKRSVPTKTSGKAARPVAKRAESPEVSGQKRRLERVAQAEAALATATDEFDAATGAEREQDDKVGQLAEQLADARRRLDEARLTTRQAKARQREAQRRLDRARK